MKKEARKKPNTCINCDSTLIWDSALGVDDITAIYNDTSTGKTADLSLMDTPPVAWYRMGD